MVLRKLPVLGRPTYLDLSRARAFCACMGVVWTFFSHLSFLFLSDRLKYCLKGPLSPKQPTNQLMLFFH